MNYRCKLTILTLLLTATYSLSFGKEIEFKLNSRGQLSPPIEPRVGWLGNVRWVIGDPGIQTFIIRAKDSNTSYIFTDPLPTTPQTSLKMHVKARLDAYDWYYSIDWTDQDGISHHVDPKIPVKPLLSPLETVLLFGFILAALSSIVYRRRWQTAKAKLVANGLSPGR